MASVSLIVSKNTSITYLWSTDSFLFCWPCLPGTNKDIYHHFDKNIFPHPYMTVRRKDLYQQFKEKRTSHVRSRFIFIYLYFSLHQGHQPSVISYSNYCFMKPQPTSTPHKRLWRVVGCNLCCWVYGKCMCSFYPNMCDLCGRVPSMSRSLISIVYLAQFLKAYFVILFLNWIMFENVFKRCNLKCFIVFICGYRTHTELLFKKILFLNVYIHCLVLQTIACILQNTVNNVTNMLFPYIFLWLCFHVCVLMKMNFPWMWWQLSVGN